MVDSGDGRPLARVPTLRSQGTRATCATCVGRLRAIRRTRLGWARGWRALCMMWVVEGVHGLLGPLGVVRVVAVTVGSEERQGVLDLGLGLAREEGLCCQTAEQKRSRSKSSSVSCSRPEGPSLRSLPVSVLVAHGEGQAEAYAIRGRSTRSLTTWASALHAAAASSSRPLPSSRRSAPSLGAGRWAAGRAEPSGCDPCLGRLGLG